MAPRQKCLTRHLAEKQHVRCKKWADFRLDKRQPLYIGPQDGTAIYWHFPPSKTSAISKMVTHFGCNHGRLVKKNVLTAKFCLLSLNVWVKSITNCVTIDKLPLNWLSAKSRVWQLESNCRTRKSRGTEISILVGCHCRNLFVWCNHSSSNASYSSGASIVNLVPSHHMMTVLLYGSSWSDYASTVYLVPARHVVTVMFIWFKLIIWWHWCLFGSSWSYHDSGTYLVPAHHMMTVLFIWFKLIRWCQYCLPGSSSSSGASSIWADSCYHRILSWFPVASAPLINLTLSYSLTNCTII